jgi:hypothetical protein
MLHFSIRDVLWLTVAVALGVGWWMDHHRVEASVSQLQQMMRENSQEREDIEALRVAYEKRIHELNVNFNALTIPPRR